MSELVMLADVVVHRDLPYTSHPHPCQHLDLYLPPQEGLLPLILWVHGGAFCAGSKDEFVPAEYLVAGYALAALNYRLSQHALWPAQIIDCKSAVRWLRAHAGQYGLDPQRFAAWGASAGGHLAAMLGVTGHTRAPISTHCFLAHGRGSLT